MAAIETILDRARTGVFSALTRATDTRLPPVRWPARVALFVNDRVGRPLCDADELTERRELERIIAEKNAAKAGGEQAEAAREAAPVVVFHLDKHKGDLPKITQILDDDGIPYELRNIEGDEATQSAVRRDSDGMPLPCVFIAGSAVGGRTHLTNLSRAGTLKKLVWGD